MTEDQIVHEYLPLVKSIARKYQGLPQEDLIQEGMLGLIHAFRKYDPEREAKFSTYATYYIRKYILQAIKKEYQSAATSQELDQTSYTPISSDPEQADITLPDSMPEIEKRIILLSIGKQKTLREISILLQLRVEQVRVLREKALRRLKQGINRSIFTT
ncbi:MAG: sigma-70 family RNA polymerase sigma factor [Candidatus Cloacimonadaceae bacterium]|nr:sigma-70 family RNA polymerase sigma factor [Candidatus Cloacimonadota bacterium]MDY0319815.1 sigma-70 family RNA polymerase sigma factor [Candidatus Cloacimonadaceae bacterium]